MGTTQAIRPVAGDSRTSRLLVGYVVMLAVGLASFFWVRAIGERQAAMRASGIATAADTATGATDAATSPAAAPSRSVENPPAKKPHTLPKLLLALITILVTAQAVGWLFRFLAQPRVIGEMVAGFLLGPTLLGRLAPGTVEWLFPPAIHPMLSVLAQLGVLLFIFLVGLEFNAALFKTNAAATITISHASIVVPMVSAAILSLWLFPAFAPPGVSFTNFSLFMGVAMSITAFPVLARILVDRKMDRSELGTLAIACAAVDDATAWWLLAITVGVASTGFSLGHYLASLACFAVYLVVLLTVIRPAIIRWQERSQSQDLSRQATGLLLVAIFASALLTEWTGISAIFGAFLLGAVIPHDSPLAESFRGKLEDVVHLLLLPVFFAYTGVTSKIDLTTSDWFYCAAVVFVATAGKWGGTMLAARWVGYDWPTSSSLGLLMNSRGLIELIVLTIGRDIGILSPELFGMMVIMAIVTTMATSPLLPFFAPASSRPGGTGDPAVA